MITEKIDREIEFEISYDILDAAIHRCLSNTVRGFVDFEREEKTRGTIIYTLSQFKLGIFAKIRIDKLSSETTNMLIFELREPFTPRQKQEFFDDNDSLKDKLNQLLLKGLENQTSTLNEEKNNHYNNVIENLLNQLYKENIWIKDQTKPLGKTEIHIHGDFIGGNIIAGNENQAGVENIEKKKPRKKKS